MNYRKAARMAGAAFDNGLRLHLDSITLYECGSYPSAFQLSILAQEELGKTFFLEEHVFQEGNHGGDESDEEFDKEYNEWFMDTLYKHRKKQTWFSRHADEQPYLRKRIPKIAREVYEGKLEKRKQLATYVGLTEKNGRADLKGKITEPAVRIHKTEAGEHITRVNDFLIELCEGVRRGTYGIDTDEVDERLTLDLVARLERTWKVKTSRSRARLKRIRAVPLDEDED